MQRAHKRHCGYCQSELLGKYCHQCGVYTPTGPLTLRQIATDFYERVIQFELSFFRSCALLLWRPQQVIQAFLHGTRRTYTHPFTLLLLLGAATILFTNVLQPDFWQAFRQMMTATTPVQLSSAEAKRYVDFYYRLYNLLPYWMLLFTLPSALICRLLLPALAQRQHTVPRYFAEYYIILLYAVCQALLLNLIWSLLSHVFGWSVMTQTSGTNALLLLCQLYCLLRVCGWRRWTIPVSLFALLSSYISIGLLQPLLAAWYAT